MTRVWFFVRSSIGRKIVMAVSGVVLFVFVLGHMSGNLLVYGGPAMFNAYAAALRKVPELLWAVRLGLFVMAVLHIWSTASLTLTNWQARPTAYRRWEPQESTYASRTMRWGGVLLALFIVYHILHLTLGKVHPSFDESNPYHNVIAGFSVWPVSLFYILAMLALGLHLYHGFWSMLQTLGVNHPRINAWRERLALFFAVVITGGFISVPVSVLAGLVR